MPEPTVPPNITPTTIQAPVSVTDWKQIATMIAGIIAVIATLLAKPDSEPVVVIPDPPPVVAPVDPAPKPKPITPVPTGKVTTFVKDAKGLFLADDALASQIAGIALKGANRYEVIIVQSGAAERRVGILITDGTGPQPPPIVTVPTVPVAPVTTPVAAVTYVYEKDQGSVPPAVLSGLNKLNREKKILATALEDDATDGTGEVPEQYKAALTAARAQGLPTLVAIGTDGKVIRTVKAPTTETAVMEIAP